MALTPAAFIAQKRDGGSHLPADIHWLIENFQSGKLTDYQMTAWLMAVYLNGLNQSEMLALTEAMLHSGKVLGAPPHSPPRIDKHSTGGVGDKISIPLAPIVAACNVHVPMIAGRGLGHTGGTLDKLEAIPGYNTALRASQFTRCIKQCGASIIGQTKDIAPADKRIYALRDVTSTVACRPLIVASILSKKLAEGLDGLVLDVKVGRGAFMKNESEARALARSLVDVAEKLGTKTVARLTQMNAPLGRTIGNALEIKESIEILRGEGPSDTTELTYSLAEEMLLLAGVENNRRAARGRIARVVSSGHAAEIFQKMIACHGGDAKVVEDVTRLPRTQTRTLIKAHKSGIVQEVDPLALATVALEMGAGRKRAADKIDPAVGIEVHVKVGDRIEKGDLMATLHVRKRNKKLTQEASAAFRVGRKRIEREPLFLGKTIRA